MVDIRGEVRPRSNGVEGRGDMTVEEFLASLYPMRSAGSTGWAEPAGISPDELEASAVDWAGFVASAVEFLDLKYDGKVAADRTQTLSQLMDQRTGESDIFSLLTERVKPGLIDKVQRCLRC